MNWQDQIKNSITCVEDIENRFNINFNSEEKESISEIIKEFPMRITPHFAKLIDWKDPEDPIKKLVVPNVKEKEKFGNTEDGYGDKPSTVTNIPGLEHKYPQTVLILATNTCPSYCRECFRRSFVGTKEKACQDFRSILTPDNYALAGEYISKHPEITDILISGGEPLMLSAGMLDLLLTSLIKNAPNIKTIRIGTKIFSYLPQRISEDKELLNVFQKYANKIDLRIMHHLQHPKEITSEMKESVKITKKLGIGHYSQTVMLRGVSDNPKILKQLFQEMDSIGIVPYYVFEKMPQKGTAHLSVSTEEGFNIFKEATYGIEGTAQTAKYVIPNQIGKLHIIDIYEKEGKKFAKARYLKVERNYKGPIEFEMKL